MSIYINKVEVFCDHQNCDDSLLMEFPLLPAIADCVMMSGGMMIPDEWYGVVGDCASVKYEWDIDPLSLITKCPQHRETT